MKTRAAYVSQYSIVLFRNSVVRIIPTEYVIMACHMAGEPMQLNGGTKAFLSLYFWRPLEELARAEDS